MQYQKKTNVNGDIDYCEDRERLKNAFLQTVRDLTDLQALQTRAVMDNDPDFVRFDDLIQMARRAKDDAKYALVAHMENHCYPQSSATFVSEGESYREMESATGHRSGDWRQCHLAVGSEPAPNVRWSHS